MDGIFSKLNNSWTFGKVETSFCKLMLSSDHKYATCFGNRDIYMPPHRVGHELSGDAKFE